MPRKRTLRQLRKILRRKKNPQTTKERVDIFFRVLRKEWFKAIRFLVYFIFRLWLKKIHNEHNLPKTGPAMIVSNHLSYYDWAVLSAIYWDRYLVFIGNKDLLNRGFVGWLMKLNFLIFIDPTNPGRAFLKESLTKLKDDNILVIYPEGTRSRTGRMLTPKTGFIRIALKTGVPVIPVGMKGTYRILPPHKKFPRLKQCEVIVGKPILLNYRNPMFRDLFEYNKGKHTLSDEGEVVAARRIMEVIRKMTGQDWHDDVPEDC